MNHHRLRRSRGEEETSDDNGAFSSPSRRCRAPRDGDRPGNHGRRQRDTPDNTESGQSSEGETDQRGIRVERNERKHRPSQTRKGRRDGDDSRYATSDSETSESHGDDYIQQSSSGPRGTDNSRSKCRSRQDRTHERRQEQHEEDSNVRHTSLTLPASARTREPKEQRRHDASQETDTDSHESAPASNVDDTLSPEGRNKWGSTRSAGTAPALGNSDGQEPSATQPSLSNSAHSPVLERPEANSNDRQRNQGDATSTQPAKQTGGKPTAGVTMGKPIRGARSGEAIGLRSRIFDTTTIPTVTAELKRFVCSPLLSGPGSVLRCFIERNRSGAHKFSRVFSLYADLEDGSGRLLLAARKARKEMWKKVRKHAVTDCL